MRFVYKSEKNQAIINHEEELFEKYSEIIRGYTANFAQYNCILKVGIGWKNSLVNDNAENRLPFKNGYLCFVYCDVEMDGEVIRYEDKDGEVDFYEVSACWSISSISRLFFNLNVCMYEDGNDVIEEMDRLLKIVASCNLSTYRTAFIGGSVSNQLHTPPTNLQTTCISC